MRSFSDSVHGAVISRTEGKAMASRLAGLDTTEKKSGSLKQHVEPLPNLS